MDERDELIEIPGFLDESGSLSEGCVDIPSYLMENITAHDLIQIPSYLGPISGACDGYEVRPTANCNVACQNQCETSVCMTGCEVSTQACTTTCEKSCQTSCMRGCMTVCESEGCQTCQYACQLSCQATCEKSCTNLCETSCQNTCELSCQNCQGACQTTCERTCQNCQGACQTTCERSCQNCEGACESTCQRTCQNCQGASCQTCQGCQGICQSSCELYCQNCEGGCQSGCETTSQKPSSSGSLTVTGVTSTTISIRMSSISGATSYRVAYRELGTSGATEVSTTSLTYTITGLNPNTTYIINYRGVNSYGDGPYMSSGEQATTLPAADLWVWDDSNGNASASQTQKAYSILRGEVPADDFNYHVWNDLVDKVAEMRDAIGMEWASNANHPTAAGCKVSAGDTLSAKKYNGVRVNIGTIISTGIVDVIEGEEITGYHIVHLTDVLNEILSEL